MSKRTLPIFPILAMLVIGACTELPASGITSSQVTSVVQTMTATMWTPTPSPTAEPNTLTIIDALNGAIINSDPLRDTIEAKFGVLDVRLPLDAGTHQITTIEIDVECEWILAENCAPEDSFVNLMHGFSANDKVFKRISAQVPASVNTLVVNTFDHRSMDGTVVVNWRDVVDFATGKINGNQLGSRIVRIIRMAHQP